METRHNYAAAGFLLLGIGAAGRAFLGVPESCDLHLYEVYVKGFIEGCGGALTETELDMLPMGAILMTFECGMRFLTDYLEGDHYFKIHREGHNLDRCRTQFKLVKDMEEKLSRMKEIVNKYK